MLLQDHEEIVERGIDEMAKRMERMALQPRVTLQYNDEYEVQAREVCLCLCSSALRCLLAAGAPQQEVH